MADHQLTELDEQMTSEAIQVDALQRRLAAVRSVATSPCGAVTAEVDSEGVLCALRLAPDAVDVGAEELADKIRDASRTAHGDLPDRLREAVAKR